MYELILCLGSALVGGVIGFVFARLSAPLTPEEIELMKKPQNRADYVG